MAAPKAPSRGRQSRHGNLNCSRPGFENPRHVPSLKGESKLIPRIRLFQISQNPSLRFTMIDVAGVRGANPVVRVQYTLSASPTNFLKKAPTSRRFAFLPEGCCPCVLIRDPHTLGRRRPRSRASRQSRFRHRRSYQVGNHRLRKAQTRTIRRRCWQQDRSCPQLGWCSR